MAKKTTKKKATKKSSKKATKKKAKVTKKKATKKKAAKKVKKKTKRKPNAAFMRPLTPSAELAEVVGKSALPRTQVVKKIWAYIKSRGLQDKSNKRMINTNAELKAIFNGKSQVSMFDMAKLLNNHLS
jgi:upstream activation factor subunit UAF30